MIRVLVCVLVIFLVPIYVLYLIDTIKYFKNFLWIQHFSFGGGVTIPVMVTIYRLSAVIWMCSNSTEQKLFLKTFTISFMYDK